MSQQSHAYSVRALILVIVVISFKLLKVEKVNYQNKDDVVFVLRSYKEVGCEGYSKDGLVTPILFYGKVFLQKLWIEELRWDDYLLSPRVGEDYGETPGLQVPRYICDNSKSVSYQILTYVMNLKNLMQLQFYFQAFSNDTIQVHGFLLR